MRKTKMLTLAAAGATTLILVSSSPTQAFWPFGQNNETDSGFHPVIQKIIDRFGLNQDEVQVVLDEAKEEHRAEMEQKKEEYLNQAVADGTITEEQKQLLQQKHEEMQANREAWRNLSREERREQMQAHHEEMQSWAEENGIDLEELMPLKGRFGEGRGMHRGWNAEVETN